MLTLIPSKKHDIGEITKLKQDYRKRFVSYSISDELKDLCFTKGNIDRDGYIEYKPGLFIKNLTTAELESEQMSAFKIRADETVTVSLHAHNEQSQTLFVKKGMVVDTRGNMMFEAGQSYFITKSMMHEVKYMKGTIALVVYLPNLDII